MRKKNSKRRVNKLLLGNYRTSNNYDDIQAMIITYASHPRLVDRLLPASTTITPHITTGIC